MARQSAIVTYYVDQMPWATDPETGEEVVGSVADVNMRQVTLDDHPLPADVEHPRERHVFEADPSHRTPDDLPGNPATVTVIGAPWTVEDLRAAHPDAARYVLDARYEVIDPETGEAATRRTREVAVPDGATVLESGLPSHAWAGDDQ